MLSRSESVGVTFAVWDEQLLLCFCADTRGITPSRFYPVWFKRPFGTKNKLLRRWHSETLCWSHHTEVFEMRSQGIKLEQGWVSEMSNRPIMVWQHSLLFCLNICSLPQGLISCKWSFELLTASWSTHLTFLQHHSRLHDGWLHQKPVQTRNFCSGIARSP